jgi:tetratricopeptide (TPR) repeat protein
MILWNPPEGDNVAPPAIAQALLRRAVAADPDNPALHLKLAAVAMDRFDFDAAAERLEAALRLGAAEARSPLAHCFNQLRRHEQVLEILPGGGEPHHERAVAQLRLGREREAEAEFRAVLSADPNHRHACRQLCKLLRKSDRAAESLAICEDLQARGASHAQLFHDWGWALALDGDLERARALLPSPARIAELELPPPTGFADITEFNRALADELTGNPCILSDFNTEEEANRGSSRVHSLFAGRNPELIRTLLATLERVIESWRPARAGGFDPWLDARPAAARLKAWGLIQRGGDYEEWHIHRGGWLSGVYYVEVPSSVADAADGRGSIEYGPPRRLAEAMPDLISRRRVTPREGHLLLAPSHYPHRTIPTGAAELRISFAFDVVPEPYQR